MQRVFLALAILLTFSGGGFAFASTPLPQPTGYVNDFAKVLSAEARSNLEAELVQFNASTTNEVAVVTVDSLQGDYIEHYAAELFKQWGIGTKKNDNGVLLLLVPSEHELRIEVGYGLEGALPDATAASIIRDMTPYLKKGDYDGAVLLGVGEILKATQWEYVATTSTGVFPSWLNGNTVYVIFFVAIGLLQWFAAVLARSKSYWAGGVVGALIGVGVSSFFGWWLLVGLGATFVLFVLGLLFDVLVSRNYGTTRGAGINPAWWAGGRGFGGGGGFGGFGGGSSGGGGASGRW